MMNIQSKHSQLQALFRYMLLGTLGLLIFTSCNAYRYNSFQKQKHTRFHNFRYSKVNGKDHVLNDSGTLVEATLPIEKYKPAHSQSESTILIQTKNQEQIASVDINQVESHQEFKTDSDPPHVPLFTAIRRYSRLEETQHEEEMSSPALYEELQVRQMIKFNRIVNFEYFLFGFVVVLIALSATFLYLLIPAALIYLIATIINFVAFAKMRNNFTKTKISEEVELKGRFVYAMFILGLISLAAIPIAGIIALFTY